MNETDRYDSFDVRAENPTEYQSVRNDPAPLVQGDPVAVRLLIIVCVIFACVLIGLVAWPERLEGGL